MKKVKEKKLSAEILVTFNKQPKVFYDRYNNYMYCQFISRYF